MKYLKHKHKGAEHAQSSEPYIIQKYISGGRRR